MIRDANTIQNHSHCKAKRECEFDYYTQPRFLINTSHRLINYIVDPIQCVYTVLYWYCITSMNYNWEWILNELNTYSYMEKILQVPTKSSGKYELLLLMFLEVVNNTWPPGKVKMSYVMNTAQWTPNIKILLRKTFRTNNRQILTFQYECFSYYKWSWTERAVTLSKVQTKKKITVQWKTSLSFIAVPLSYTYLASSSMSSPLSSLPSSSSWSKSYSLWFWLSNTGGVWSFGGVSSFFECWTHSVSPDINPVWNVHKEHWERCVTNQVGIVQKKLTRIGSVKNCSRLTSGSHGLVSIGSRESSSWHDGWDKMRGQVESVVVLQLRRSSGGYALYTQFKLATGRSLATVRKKTFFTA